MPRKIMESFKLNEISFVDRPAQEGARMTIMKRAAETLSGALAKRYIDPADGAVSFGAVLQECLSSEMYNELSKEYSPAISALDTSLRSIAGDAALGTYEKQAMMRDSIENFMANVRTKYPAFEPALTKVLLPGESGDGDIAKGDETMDAKELEKKVAELEKTIKDLTGQLEAATTSKDAKVAAGLQKDLDAAKASVVELTAKVTAEETARKAAEGVAADAEKRSKMSDDEKSYMDRLKDDKSKKSFLDMAPEARKAEIAKAASGDETITVNGTEVRKSVVGETQFAIIKSQQDQIDKQAKNLAEEKDRRETAEYTKRAEDELSELPGENVAKAKVLKAIDSMEKDAKEALQTMLKAGAAAMKAAFTRLGHGGGPVDKSVTEAAQSFEKHINEIATRDKVGKDVAMQTARKEYPKEFEAYQALPPAQ